MTLGVFDVPFVHALAGLGAAGGGVGFVGPSVGGAAGRDEDDARLRRWSPSDRWSSRSAGSPSTAAPTPSRGGPETAPAGRVPVDEVLVRELIQSVPHIATAFRGLLARAIRTVSGGTVRPEAEPVATAVTPDRSPHVSEDAQAEPCGWPSFGDDRADAAGPEQSAVFVVVVASQGERDRTDCHFP